VTPTQLLEHLVAIIPKFRSYSDADKCAPFTLHGIFDSFTGFYRERWRAFSTDQLATLGGFVSACMTSEGESLLNNAVVTCYLETITGELCGDELSLHLTGPALWYWRNWGGRDADPLAVRIPPVTDADVRRVVVAIVPEAMRSVVLKALGRYNHDTEASRVRLAILALFNADFVFLNQLVDMANEDHLTVIRWAEHPSMCADKSDWEMVVWYGQLGLY
jgi:hypothetical protein